MPDRRLLVTIALAVVALVGVGVATFFLGPDEPEDLDPDAYVELDLESTVGSSRAVEEVLFLPWGEGETEASEKGAPVVRSTIEAAFGSEGSIYVVDHPEGVFGARVRRFTPTGDLSDTYYAPPGSTLFGPHEGGYHFVVAKAGGPSERAVLFDVESARGTTYTIPLSVNSGGLMTKDGDLYASVAPSAVDMEAERIYASRALVPVAVDGVQVSDDVAGAGVLELWGWGLDEREYTFELEILGLDAALGEVVTVIGNGADRVRVPSQYELLGVDAASSVFLVPTPEADASKQVAAGWVSSRLPRTSLLVVGLDGVARSSITLPESDRLRWGRRMPVSFCPDGVYSLREVEGGVAVVRHPFD